MENDSSLECLLFSSLSINLKGSPDRKSEKIANQYQLTVMMSDIPCTPCRRTSSARRKAS